MKMTVPSSSLKNGTILHFTIVRHKRYICDWKKSYQIVFGKCSKHFRTSAFNTEHSCV